MNPLPPLRALQVFETVGHCVGLSQAATRLGISVGAVSQQMKLLEDALGLKLTHKDGQRLRLNSVGERLHSRCSAAFEELRLAVAERAKNPCNLYISGLPSLMTQWLSPLVNEWSVDEPELAIYLDSTLDDTSGDESADFRLGYGEPAGQGVALFRDCVVPTCSPQLLVRAGSPRELLEHRLIGIDSRPRFDSPPSWSHWFNALQDQSDHGVVIRRTYSSSITAIQAAIDGQGIVLAQFSMIAADLAAGRLVIPWPFAMALAAPYSLSWHPNTLHKPQCRRFQRWLIGQGQKQDRITTAMLSGVHLDH
ncbi:MAG: HTH-type transcriptional regulator TrpI [Pseudomonas fluorescens]|nr:MAG: HTH-type transcriptional regulator TrpI [Pseudomonas fluorescens]